MEENLKNPISRAKRIVPGALLKVITTNHISDVTLWSPSEPEEENFLIVGRLRKNDTVIVLDRAKKLHNDGEDFVLVLSRLGIGFMYVGFLNTHD